jgi:hypothetical protein
MRIIGRKLLTAGLVALYGGISLLGYGLHELTPCHHHGPFGQVASHAHCHYHAHGHGDHTHCHDEHAELGNAQDQMPAVSDLCGSHDCDVCVFLAQINCDRPLVAAEVMWQDFVAEAVIVAPRIASQTILGLHIPRGPPTFVG